LHSSVDSEDFAISSSIFRLSPLVDHHFHLLTTQLSFVTRSRDINKPHDPVNQP
jgi:hypothetical protein